jgi:hypothetical protein
MKTARIVILSLLCIAAIGCARREGPAERAGARIDEMMDNLEEGRPLLEKEGAAERAGRKVDEGISATGEAIEDVGEGR